MRVLITALHYPVASGRYMAEALKRLGHDVRSWGPALGCQLWGYTLPPEYAWVPDPPLPGWVPDLVLHMDGNWCPDAGEVDALAAGEVASPRFRATSPDPTFGRATSPALPYPLRVVYGVDNHVRDYRFPGVAWDHLFLAHGSGTRMDEAHVTWLPCAHDPVWFTPGLPLAERPITLALIGVLYPARSALLAAIRAALPETRLLTGTGAVYGDYAAAYQAAQISLVCSVAGDVAQRVFETAAMGCLVIMDDCPDAAPLGLIDGENCLIYRTPAEAVARIRWARDHPAAAQQIAALGQVWAQAHTWDARAAVIVAWTQKAALIPDPSPSEGFW